MASTSSRISCERLRLVARLGNTLTRLGADSAASRRSMVRSASAISSWIVPRSVSMVMTRSTLGSSRIQAAAISGIVELVWKVCDERPVICARKTCGSSLASMILPSSSCGG
jgi:hypothetical protein